MPRLTSFPFRRRGIVYHNSLIGMSDNIGSRSDIIGAGRRCIGAIASAPDRSNKSGKFQFNDAF
jgi:hypothetical protein